MNTLHLQRFKQREKQIPDSPVLQLALFPSLITKRLSAVIRKKVILGAQSYDSPVWGKAPGCALLGCCQW